jgi:uncharacterized protein involved in exopolysaccharide biosynthesis
MDASLDVSPRTTHEITLHEIKADIRAGRYFVVATVLGLAIVFAVYGVLRMPSYVASTVVVPVESGGVGGTGGLGALASQYSALASVAGISVGASTKAPEYLAVLQSEFLTEKFIQANNLLPILFSSKWDARLKTWKAMDPKKIPTLWAANQFFSKRVRSVSQEKSTGLVTLSIRWRNPAESAHWANALVKMTNDDLRNKSIAESERNIAFLNDEAAKTNVVELKQNIYTLIQREIGTEMIARGREEFALKVLDPAYPAEKPSSLGPAPLGILGALAGILLSVLVVFSRRVYLSA